MITESGSFYTFNVKYADEPLLLNIEMADFIHDGSEVNRPNNALDIYLKKSAASRPSWYTLLPRPSTRTTDAMSAYREQGVRHPVPAARALTHNGCLFPYLGEEHVERALCGGFRDVQDRGREAYSRTGHPRTGGISARAYNYAQAGCWKAGRAYRLVVFDKFTIPADKMLVVEMHQEKKSAVIRPYCGE